MLITESFIKKIIAEELKIVKEGFYGRRRYGSSRYGGGYGGYDSGYQKEEDPDWHARPGEEFTVPGEAYMYFTLVTPEGKDQPMRRKFSYYSSSRLADKEMEVEQSLMDKYSEANKASNEGMVFKSIGRTEVISKPHKVEN